MALGAFVAGLLLAETEFRKAIETAIDPFKGLLLGLFFYGRHEHRLSASLPAIPVWLLGSAVGLVAVKSIILTALARLVSPFLARIHRSGPPARPGRRVRLRRHRHGDNARSDRCQGVEASRSR